MQFFRRRPTCLKVSNEATARRRSPSNPRSPSRLRCPAAGQGKRGVRRMSDLARDALPGLRHFDLHLEHIQVLLALDIHLEQIPVLLALDSRLDVLRIDLDVLADDVAQLALQRREIAGLAPAANALVRQDDLQPLLGDLGAGFSLAEKKRKE